jgi:hypothetical protein
LIFRSFKRVEILEAGFEHRASSLAGEFAAFQRSSRQPAVLLRLTEKREVAEILPLLPEA